MRNQMRQIEQKKVGYILDDIKDAIEAAKEMMEKPYEEADDGLFKDALDHLRRNSDVAFTLCRLGLEEVATC